MGAYRRIAAGLLSLCLFLSACGGGDSEDAPTPLPARVSINASAAADTTTPVSFASDVANASGALSLRWEFGDGASSAEAAPTHLYPSPGDYQVTLTVTNEDGATVSGQFTVQVRRNTMVQGAACSGGDGKGWCWQRPLPAGNQVNDLYFHDANIGWAVGDAGQILKTTDGGTTWVQQRSPVSARLTQVRFADANVGWAVGEWATVLRSVDGGVNWTRQASEAPYWGYGDYGISVTDGQRAVLTERRLAVATTQDGGQSWRSINMDEAQVTEAGTVWSLQYRQIVRQTLDAEREVVFSYDSYDKYIERFSMGSESNGLVVVGDYNGNPRTWLRTSDAGRTWPSFTPLGLPAGSVEVLDLVGANHAWALIDYKLFRSTDAGTNWVQTSLPPDADPWELSSMVVKDGNTLWFPHRAGFYLTTDAGANWSLLQIADYPWYGDRTLWVAPGGTWIQYGDQIHVTADQGATWRHSLGPAGDEGVASMTAMWFFDSLKGMAVSSMGWLLETTDGGRSWGRRALDNQQSYNPSRLQFVSTTVGWLSGNEGVRKTTDGGSTWWLPVSDVDMSHVRDFHFVNANNGWALTGNKLVRSTDGGGSWALQFEAPYGMRAVHFVDAQVGVMVGDTGTAMRTTDGGFTWSLRPTGVRSSLSRVRFVDAQNGWAVGDEGVVIRTADGGLNWSQVAVPGVAYGTRLNDVHFVDALRGWLVGDDGLILATTDGGHSWARQESGTRRGLYSLFMLDAYSGWVGGASGTMLATATSGD